jgi:hypothetical protein
MQQFMIACSDIVTFVARVVVRAVVPGLELDEELLLLDEAVAVVVLLVVSPAVTSASMSSKSSSATCCLPFLTFLGILLSDPILVSKEVYWRTRKFPRK